MPKHKAKRKVVGIANLNQYSRARNARVQAGDAKAANNGEHKHFTRALTKLSARRNAAPANIPGYKLPGSMNPKKQG